MNNDERSHGLWEASARPAPLLQELRDHVTADVIVIGGGFTGCSAALHLAEAGQRAVLLEAHEIGFGGSGRNVGLVNAGLWVMPEELPNQLGALHGERLLEQLGHAPSLVFDLVKRYAIDCQATTTGTLHCAVGEDGWTELEERARQWRTRGADVELLDATATAGMVGTKAYSGALLDRRAGTIQPLGYVRGLAAAAAQHGTEIFVRSPAIGRQDLGDRWRISTTTGSVTAPWVIVATDAYSQGIWSPILREQVMLPYFNLATRPLSGNLQKSILPGRQGVWDTKQILSSMRFDKDGRLIFGSVGALRGPGVSIHRNWGRRELHRLFPELLDIEFEHEWYGQIGMTDDALPRFHRHDRNIVSISGFNGRGIAPGTTFGRDLARLAMGEVAVEDLALPLTGLTPVNFRSLKSAFFEVGAQAAHFVGSRFSQNTH
jgi:glycine/D-amino acid oxidase-like deaminating enzyme